MKNYPYHSTGEIPMLSFTRSEWFPTSRKYLLYAVHAKKQRKIIHTILPESTAEISMLSFTRSEWSPTSRKDFLYAVHAKNPYHSTGEISMLSFTRSEWFPTSRKKSCMQCMLKRNGKLSIPFYRWNFDALVHAERVIPNIQKRFPVCSAC